MGEINECDRIEWVDALKFLAIFAIYVGHFEDPAGNLVPYVFTYHVPLFFLVSGFFALPKKEMTILSYIKKNCFSILLPYFIFNLIALITWSLLANPALSEIKRLFLLIFSGTRNQLTPAYSLWFLPCIFIMKITYFILYKIIKKKTIILCICVLMMYFGFYFFPTAPNLFFNIDSMFLYIFFYALGASSFSYLKKIKYNCFSIKGKIIWWIILIIVIFLSVIIFFRKTENPYGLIFYGGPFSLHVFTLPIIGITLNVYLSFWLSNFSFVTHIGKQTLMLCGNEQFVKMLIPCIFGIWGLNVAPSNPLSACLYTFILLVFVTYIVIPIEKKLIPFLRN